MEQWQEETLDRGYARNNDEWWFLVDHHWTNLSRMIETYLSQKEQDAALTAKNRRNAEVMWLNLQKTWDRMPDKPWVHQVPGFGALCDLCSDFHGTSN